MNNAKIILLAVAGIFSLSACVQNANPAPAESNNPIGMANPASKYCVSQGGKLEIKRAADGSEYGVCHLPNGTAIEEWALFRRDNSNKM